MPKPVVLCDGDEFWDFNYSPHADVKLYNTHMATGTHGTLAFDRYSKSL